MSAFSIMSSKGQKQSKHRELLPLNPNLTLNPHPSPSPSLILHPDRLISCLFDFVVRPGTPHNLRVIQAKARSVVLNFTPGPSGRAPILTYTIEYNNDSFYDPSSARWKTLMVILDAHLVWNLLPLTLPNLKPYTDYRFRVIATNKVGSSSPSNATDTIKTLETGERTFFFYINK